MEIRWINIENIMDITSDKKVFIYGYGSLGKKIGKWLEKNGCSGYSFCVDKEYLSVGLFVAEECFDLVRAGKAICIYAIGEADSFELFRKHEEIPVVFAVFDPYEFWLFDKEIYNNNINNLDCVRKLLADEQSRKTLDSYILAKRLNDGSVAISDATISGKYFNELTKKLGDGAYVDCGAYNGDTIELFRDYYNDYERKIYAFEPDTDSFELLKKNYANDGKIELIKKGLWDCKTVLSFQNGGGERSEVSVDGEILIDVVSLDEVINEKVSYIKVGAANAEKVFDGMKKIVERDMPIISTFALYSFEDLYRIPLKIKSMENGKKRYNIFLRHHSLTTCGLLFYYAIPESV